MKPRRKGSGHMNGGAGVKVDGSGPEGGDTLLETTGLPKAGPGICTGDAHGHPWAESMAGERALPNVPSPHCFPSPTWEASPGPSSMCRVPTDGQEHTLACRGAAAVRVAAVILQL